MWDVHTRRDRWWVITNPTNLYRQRDFPEADVAFTFHLGLGWRLASRNAPPTDEDEILRTAGPWRRWQQAADSLDRAHEIEDFQAIGVRCREALLSMLPDLIKEDTLPAGAEAPKDADFIHWTEYIAADAASGSSLAPVRRYLRIGAKETWDLVNWLTHSSSAGRPDAHLAIEATGHVLANFVGAVLSKERRPQPTCPSCSSVRLTEDYRPELGKDHAAVTRCRACGWEDLPDDLDLSLGPTRDFSRPTTLSDFMPAVNRMLEGDVET